MDLATNPLLPDICQLKMIQSISIVIGA